MTISEKELEDLIFNADPKDLDERGLSIVGNLRRQVRIGNYGVADMVAYDRGKAYFDYNKSPYYQKPQITVIELKKDEININTFMQAVRYAKGIKRYFEYKKYTDFDLIIKLIGSNINLDNDFIYLIDLISSDELYLEVYTYSLHLDGIFFKSHSGYCLINEGFNNNKKDIDFENF
jgi:hypothetical protein